MERRCVLEGLQYTPLRDVLRSFDSRPNCKFLQSAQLNASFCFSFDVKFQNAVYAISLSLSDRPTSFTWDKKDGLLSPQVKVEGAFLRFESLNKSDDGIYLCYADNGIGRGDGSFPLSVQGT